MLEAYVVEKLANSLNKRFAAAGLYRVVPKKTHAAHTVRERRLTRCGVPGECFSESLDSHFKAW